MIKPKKLKKGDKVATISLSWGGAGEIPYRYEAGKKQLQETFDVEVVETKNARKPNDWIYKNPQARAEDLMEALQDSNIKAIISNIGGDESLRTLPFIDFEVIKNNPKIFMGYSDTTVTHLCFYKAGVTSFYGTSILTGFAENNGMHPYQIQDIRQSLFSSKPVGLIKPNTDGWTSELLTWADPNNQNISRKLEAYTGWRWLQGHGKIQGQLLGGCVEVLEMLKGTSVWVTPEDWSNKLFFLETSEEKMSPSAFLHVLRNYAATGIFKQINGLLLARPYDNLHWKEYDEMLIKVIREEEGLEELPIITGMDFGHTDPVFTIPFGVKAEINCDKQTLAIIENAVTD